MIAKLKPERAAAKLAARRCIRPYCRGRLHGRNCRCSKCMMRDWRAKYPVKAAYSDLRNRAKRRGIQFSLTFGQFAELCAASGYIEGKGSLRHSLQIDRIDPQLGYSWDNCQVLTASENATKGNYERADTECGHEPF